MRLLFLILLLLALPAAARAEDRDIAAFNRIGILEGVAIGDALWLRGAGLVRLDLKAGKRTEIYKDGVIDMARYGPQLWVLRAEGKETLALVSFEGDGPPVTRASWKRLADEDYIGMLMGPGTAFVLSYDRLLSIDTSGVIARDRRLTGLHGGARLSGLVMPAGGGGLYVGFNSGEFGGEFERIDLGSGEVTRLEAAGDELCSGLLNLACDPITGLAPDPARPDCVLASVGLAHMLLSGRILRACGKDLSLLAQWPVPAKPRPARTGSVPPPPNWDELPGQTLPVFGLATARGQVWGVTFGKLILVGGQPEMRDLPKFETVDGIELSRAIDGFVVVRTTMNASFSLSGATPLLVPVE